jgi:hypothetical protein
MGANLNIQQMFFNHHCIVPQRGSQLAFAAR